MAADANANSSPTAAAAATATASPPWSQIVRGPEPDPEPEPKPKPDVASPANAVVVAGNSVDNNGDNNGAVSKKSSAWNKKPMSKPSVMNGEAAESGGAAVNLGVESWPSLSEGTKVSPKLSSSSSSFDTNNINVPDFGSNLPPQVSGIDTPSTATVQFSVRSPSLASQKQTMSNSNHHVNSNHARSSRQKFTKRDGGGNSLANGSSHQSSQPIGEGAHYHHNHGFAKPNPGSSFENSGRDNVQTHNHREFGQRNTSGEYYHRNSFRKGNGGSHSRGDGSHQNYATRRSEERGNHDYNHQRSFNGRDASMRPRVPHGGVARPPPMNPQLYYPAMPPFPNHIMPIFLPVSPAALVGPYGPLYVPVPSELYSDLLMQINYYFSNDNLVRDTFLRRQMDDNGWVHVDVIADFPKVKLLTTDTYIILEAVRPSSVVEVQADKMRKRDDWRRWVLPPALRFPTASGSQTRSANQQAVAAVTDRIQSVSVDETTNQADSSANVSQAPSSSGDSNTPSKDEANSGGC